MGDEADKPVVERRNFLKGAGIAAVGAAVAAQAAPAEAATTKEAGPDRVKARYQETEHVRRFYALNRWVSGV